MSLTPDDVQQFVGAAQIFSRAASRIEAMGQSGGNTSTITVQGGAGLTIACCAAVVSFLACIVVLAVYLDTRAQVRRIEDYQQTTFMLVPDLKKLVDEEMKRRQESAP